MPNSGLTPEQIDERLARVFHGIDEWNAQNPNADRMDLIVHHAGLLINEGLGRSIMVNGKPGISLYEDAQARLKEVLARTKH
jgi:hypothetical protein